MTLYFNDIKDGIKTLDGSIHGFLENHDGYIMIYEPTHKNARKDGWIREHRWIMSEILGRPLTKKEVVHHINGFKKDNRIENLELLDKKSHDRINYRDMKEVFCYLCGRDKPYINTKHHGPQWHFDIDRKIICEWCYQGIRHRYKIQQKKLGKKI